MSLRLPVRRPEGAPQTTRCMARLRCTYARMRTAAAPLRSCNPAAYGNPHERSKRAAAAHLRIVAQRLLQLAQLVLPAAVTAATA